MDLCADMLVSHLPSAFSRSGVVPPFQRRFEKLPRVGHHRMARNADRLLNRFWDYPRYVRRRNKDFEAFHVCDHSYAHLLHSIPRGRGGVFCHDLDAFRCLLDPKAEPRPRWFRQMARHILSGLQKAMVVFFSTEGVRQQIVTHGLVDPSRLIHAPYGVSAEFRLDGDNVQPPIETERPFLLHVGSCIPRKRIDVLFDVFAAVHQRYPGLRLVQVGGTWTADQSAQARRLGIGNSLTQVRGISRSQLAALYRSAELVLQPSEAEGFGLPIIEALACGTNVVASDLPVLREVGGDAVTYCRVADIGAWSATVYRLLADPSAAPTAARRQAQAGRFSWTNHACIIANAYLGLLGAGTNSKT